MSVGWAKTCGCTVAPCEPYGDDACEEGVDIPDWDEDGEGDAARNDPLAPYNDV